MKEIDIKEIWKGDDSHDEYNYSSQSIERMIADGSHSIMSKFVKTLFWEQTFNLIALTLSSIYLVYRQEWLVSVVVLIINAIFFFYYQILRKKLSKKNIDRSVTEYLLEVGKMVKRFIRHLHFAIIIMVFISIASSIYLFGQGFYDEEYTTKGLVVGIIVGLVIAIPLSLYFIHLLYGKKAIKLGELINSLKQQESDS